jgi:transcriptional regulator with XRE-family HTH domain
LTQQQLSAQIGIQRPTLTQIEGGKPTTTEVVERWVSCCGGSLVVDTTPDPLSPVLRDLSAPDRALLIDLARIMPLDPADDRTLRLLIEGWSRVVRSVDCQEDVKSSIG